MSEHPAKGAPSAPTSFQTQPGRCPSPFPAHGAPAALTPAARPGPSPALEPSMERDTPTVKDIARALADRIATDVPVRDVIVNFRVRPQTTSGYKDRSSGGPLTTIARSVHAELYGLPNDPVEEPPTLAALLDAAHSQQPLAASRRPARTGCPAPPARRDPRPHDSLGEPTPRRPSRRGRVARGNRRRHPRRGDRTRTDPAHPRHPHSPAIVTAIQPQCGAGAGHRASPATPATCQRRDVRSETLTRLPRPTNPTITERTVFTDAHITFGTTADGGTLAVVAADLPPVHGILLAAGFAPDGHHGTFHYRLPPGPSSRLTWTPWPRCTRPCCVTPPTSLT